MAALQSTSCLSATSLFGAQRPLTKGCDFRALSKTIWIIAYPLSQLKNIPDIGMDRFLVSKGKPLATSGLGPCFAVCSIGRTRFNTPVLGLCHMSSLVSFSYVHARLKTEMKNRENVLEETIKTYVIGGQGPAKEAPEGTLDEERKILAIASAEKIEEVLFNQVNPEDELESLSVVLTPHHIFVSKKDLSCVTGKDDGISLFDAEE